MHLQIAGLPWFAEDGYESFRALLPDRHWHANEYAARAYLSGQAH